MVTQERLLEVLRYDQKEGRFYWLKKGRGMRSHKLGQAGSFDAHGYGQVYVDGKVYKEHRLVWLYVYGELPIKQIDHINHDRRDNRIKNLRLVDDLENRKNKPNQRNNKSGVPGVCLSPKGKYKAYISVNKKRISLGSHDTFESAKLAREEANKKYGFHANHGASIGKSRKPPLLDGEYRSNTFFIEFNGISMNAVQWSKYPGCTVTGSVIRNRLRHGWSVKDAIFIPHVTQKIVSSKRERLPNGRYKSK